MVHQVIGIYQMEGQSGSIIAAARNPRSWQNRSLFNNHWWNQRFCCFSIRIWLRLFLLRLRRQKETDRRVSFMIHNYTIIDCRNILNSEPDHPIRLPNAPAKLLRRTARVLFGISASDAPIADSSNAVIAAFKSSRLLVCSALRINAIPRSFKYERFDIAHVNCF